MIDLKLIDDEIKLFFSGDNFEEILDLAKKAHLKYDPEDKSRAGDNSTFYHLIPKLKQIEPFNVSDEIMEIIKPKLKVIRKRRIFKRELFKAEKPLGEYQLEDTKKMLNTNGIINGSEPGLGKTLESITVINHLIDSNEIDKILILAVPEVCYNWKKELLTFSDFFKEEDILIASKDLRNPFDYSSKIVICSYNTFLLIEKYYHALNNKGKKLTKKTRKKAIDFSKWGKSICCILDEAHKIKSLDGFQSKTILKYRNDFSFKYLLSGTPHPNSIAEIYNLLKFIDENIIYSDYNTFIESIADIGNRFSEYAINYFYENKVRLLMEKIQPYLFRRYKKQALPNLPEQTIKKIYVEMKPKQKLIYQKVISEKLQSLKEEKGDIYIKDVENSFPYLILTLSDPSILKGKIISDNTENHINLTDEIQKLIEDWKFRDNSKLETLDYILEEHKNEKIIIWSTHPATINALSDYYKNYNHISVHGKSHEVFKEDKDIFRERMLEKFKTDKNCNLAILNPAVLGTGVNISESTVAIFFDRSFDVKEWIQALGRNHRGTSTKNVIAYVLIMDNSLESGRLDKRISNKEELNNNASNFDTLPLAKWKSIFEGN